MAITRARMGEIAILLIKDRMKKDGIRLGGALKRDLGNTAKELSVPVLELHDVAEILTRELVEEAFSNK